jgi:branched-subunit amino acid transport protein
VNVYMLLVTAGLVLATFMTRTALLLVGQRLKLSPHVEAALRYAPVCALAVLIVPEVLVRSGTVDLSLTNPRLVAAGVAAVVFLKTRSMVACIVVGTLTVATFRYLWGT